MPRVSKKAEEKAKAAIPAPTMVVPPVLGIQPPVNTGNGPRVVDNDSFLRVRDSAVSRLATILDLLRSFTNDYIRQTNLLLGEHNGDVNELIGSFDPAAAAAQLMLPVGDLAAPAVEEKKERKKRTHDPNAPKRPLTPYFLYMQHARSIIANDLGAEAPKGAVQEEGQRRWATMTTHDKQGWNNAYQYNLRLYNARVQSYKAGNLNAKDMTDEEALKYAEEFGVAMPELKDASKNDNVQAAIAEQLQDDSAKTPKKSGGGRKRKSDAPVAEVETPKGGPASPDKKRRRTSTKAGDDKDDSKKSARKNKK
ncbi:hypothetical protein PWT90_10812 [Aphanocladium album]|nr:hypothetical protein PWT90_10812 [Aphanocladium album]